MRSNEPTRDKLNVAMDEWTSIQDNVRTRINATERNRCRTYCEKITEYPLWLAMGED